MQSRKSFSEEAAERQDACAGIPEQETKNRTDRSPLPGDFSGAEAARRSRRNGSSLNSADLRVDFSRFSPLPALYTVVLAVVLLTNLANVSDYHSGVRVVQSVITSMAAVQFVYALLVSQCLFGYLFDGKLSSAIHALPQTRSTRFRTHLFTGLLFSVLPHLLMAVVCHFTRRELDTMIGWWLLISGLQYLYFFGCAVLASLCAGNRVGGLMVYGLLTCLPLLGMFLLNTLVQPLLFGVEVDTGWLEYLWPLAQMTRNSYLDIAVTWENPYQNGVVQSITPISSSFRYLGVCAGLGVLATALAGQLYRRRQLECAGELLSVNWLKPVFLALYSVAFGTVCQLLVSLFGGISLNAVLFVGVILGFYTGLMLLQRQVNVFRLKTVPAALGLCAAILLPLVLIGLDVPGTIRKVPAESQIASVTVSPRYSEIGLGVRTDSREDIAKVRAIHLAQVQSWQDWRARNRGLGEILEEINNRAPGAEEGAAAVTVRLRYTLTDGRTLCRAYRVPAKTEAGQLCRDFLARPSSVLGVSSREALSLLEFEDVNCYKADSYSSCTLAQADVPGLLNALYSDCEAEKLLPGEFMPENSSVVYTIALSRKDNGNIIWIHIYDNGTEAERYLDTHLIVHPLEG